MYHRQNHKAIDHADHLPSLFAVHNSIPPDERIRVFKNEDGGLKVDPMFCHILPVLCLIPIELHVVTIL